MALDHAAEELAGVVGEANPLPDPEVHHLAMGADLLHEAKTATMMWFTWTSSSSVRRSRADTTAGRLNELVLGHAAMIVCWAMGVERYLVASTMPHFSASAEKDVHRALAGDVVCGLVAEDVQVEAGEEIFAGAEEDRANGEMEFVDETGLEELTDSIDAAADADIAAVSGLDGAAPVRRGFRR